MSDVRNIDEIIGRSFDYIIVGGGGCGLPLASRLTEDPSKTVLVLESGPSNLNDPELLRLASHGAHYGKPQYDWDHKTTPQKHLGGRSVTWTRGKGLGGSTAINFMGYTKPPARDIDDWEKLGNPGWNFEAHQKFLTRAERFQPPSSEIQKKMKINPATLKFGTEGFVGIGAPPLFSDAIVDCIETLENAGLPQAPQPYDGDPNGWFWVPTTYDSETLSRSYSATAFYLPNKDRPNLFVLTHAHAHRVLTEPSAKGALTAVGVEFGHGGSVHTARATREVILSAGALKSPQILELSGIGRRDVLEKIGVPVKLELPGVGENVQEHIATVVNWELRDDFAWETFDLLRDPEVFAKNLELLKQGEGLFTMGFYLVAYFALNMVSDKAQEIYQRAKDEIARIDPDSVPASYKELIELQLARLNPETSGPICEVAAVPAFLSGPNPPTPGKRYVGWMCGLNSVLSYGTIHAKSNNPDEDPEFDPHYLERNADAEMLLEIIKWVRSLSSVSPFKEMIAREVNPGPEVQTDEQLLEWIKAWMYSMSHTAGSLSMLPLEKGGVVDPNLKVYGTENLRVVDISVIPLHISAHTQSTAYFIAEKAADIIKASS